MHMHIRRKSKPAKEPANGQLTYRDVDKYGEGEVVAYDHEYTVYTEGTGKTVEPVPCCAALDHIHPLSQHPVGRLWAADSYKGWVSEPEFGEESSPLSGHFTDSETKYQRKTVRFADGGYPGEENPWAELVTRTGEGARESRRHRGPEQRGRRDANQTLDQAMRNLEQDTRPLHINSTLDQAMHDLEQDTRHLNMSARHHHERRRHHQSHEAFEESREARRSKYRDDEKSHYQYRHPQSRDPEEGRGVEIPSPRKEEVVDHLKYRFEPNRAVSRAPPPQSPREPVPHSPKSPRYLHQSQHQSQHRSLHIPSRGHHEPTPKSPASPRHPSQSNQRHELQSKYRDPLPSPRRPTVPASLAQKPISRDAFNATLRMINASSALPSHEDLTGDEISSTIVEAHSHHRPHYNHHRPYMAHIPEPYGGGRERKELTFVEFLKAKGGRYEEENYR
ncbi:uncharacterized protein GGS25DRAFT_168607 [Hypoxylon fragiforme]|uniref:uncharacterized protein n=1 Tax=Hypoxylon fragiforme TaxID=63214 RepID=UPI0020C6D126|nr:uncharacterized protein GGS25DRAFT_168607 [Hypoxylon fragiforme]KAI2610823.1 hypothetical protein GGS25DRAFT_168607 [Hypoxylon fragiforme]